MNQFLFINYPFKTPWTNVYGFARSIIASGTFLTLLFTPATVLLQPNEPNDPLSTLLLYKLNLFTLVANLEYGRAFALIILFTVIIGWRPKITGLLHAWVAISFMHRCVNIDGGDQMNVIFSILLLPICLTDPRMWHWKTVHEVGAQNDYVKLIALSSFLMIRVQVAIIYLHAATAKFSVTEWVNGTAVWYWFNDPIFGYNSVLKTILLPLIENPLMVTLITWGAIAIELLLFLALFVESKKRKYFLALGLMFHFSILLIHGLFSFFFAISGALILYLWPIDSRIPLSTIYMRLNGFLCSLTKFNISKK